MKSRIVTRELKPAKSPEDFRLHCAALEWSLAEPIVINAAEDIKSRVDWKDCVEPFHHQVQNLMRFCRRLPVTLLADDVGLGKTITAGLIVSELMKRTRIGKVFVVCPKILIPQWVEELDAKFGIKAYGGSGAAVQGAARCPEPVFVTTYHSASRFLEEGNAAGFDMLILDEAHKVRNLHGPPNPPRMATAIFDALEARTFKYVLMLTATPIQNRLWDIATAGEHGPEGNGPWPPRHAWSRSRQPSGHACESGEGVADRQATANKTQRLADGGLHDAS